MRRSNGERRDGEKASGPLYMLPMAVGWRRQLTKRVVTIRRCESGPGGGGGGKVAHVKESSKQACRGFWCNAFPGKQGDRGTTGHLWGGELSGSPHSGVDGADVTTGHVCGEAGGLSQLSYLLLPSKLARLGKRAC